MSDSPPLEQQRTKREVFEAEIADRLAQGLPTVVHVHVIEAFFQVADKESGVTPLEKFMVWGMRNGWRLEYDTETRRVTMSQSKLKVSPALKVEPFRATVTP